MRKCVRWMGMMVTLCLLILSVSACGGTEKAGEGITESTLTLYNGEESVQYVAQYGREASVSVPQKSGYYFLGYFDAENGGTKYIDGSGRSTKKWEKSDPTALYAQWDSVSNLSREISVFGNEPEQGNAGGQRTATVQLDEELRAAIQGNATYKLKIEYRVDLKTGDNWDPSPIAMYIKGYDNAGAEKHDVFTLTPVAGEFSTFEGSAAIPAGDFVDGNLYVVLMNTKAQNGSLAWPTYYSRNLTLKLSLVAE